ncbi:MAG: hypothetical protein ACRDZQ_15300, partial [Acidimicrobiales bacterium]
MARPVSLGEAVTGRSERRAHAERAQRAPRPERAEGPERLLDRGPLVSLCVGANLLEAVALVLLGAGSGQSLAAQANAPVPFGVFHDLRWLLVYSNSWVSVMLEGLGLLVGRSVITALTIRAAWPSGTPRPSLITLFARATVFTLAAGALLLPMTVLLFGLAVAPVSWFFLAAVPAALIVALLFHHGAIAPGWWRQPLAPRALGWILLTFLVVSVTAEVITGVPAGAGVAIAGLAGLVEA